MGKSLKRKKEYGELVTMRKTCRACDGLTNPSEIDGGRIDSNHIGPWSRWQGNVSADLMVVGQDWGDVAYFRRHDGLDEERNVTNRTLMRLLKSIGIDIGSPESASEEHVVFFTNAILCLKEGGLQSAVRPEWFKNCGIFLRRQVEIISPKVVATLGYHALCAVREAFGLQKVRLADAVQDAKGEILFANTRLFAAYHCGARVLNTHRPLNAQLKDWKRIGRALRKGTRRP